MSPTLVAMFLGSLTLLNVTTGLADTKLTPGQQAAKSAFDSGVKAAREGAARACGIEVPVTTDFENFDKERWLDAEAEREHLKPSDESYKEWRKNLEDKLVFDDSCGKVLEAVAGLCRQSKFTAAIAQQLKGVSCLFGGYSPRKVAEQEGMDAHTRRNLSYTNGILTVRNDPRLGNVDGVAKEVLKEAIAKASGGTTEPGAQVNRGNGDRCDAWSQCQSKVCSRGVCEMCKGNSVCQKGSTCGDGVCWTKADLERKTEALPSAPKGPTPGCKPRGAPVIKSGVDECCTKRSKLVKSSRTCL